MNVKNAERLSVAAAGSCRQGLTTSVPFFPSPFFAFFVLLFELRGISGDMGFLDVTLDLPDGSKCPQGTH